MKSAAKYCHVMHIEFNPERGTLRLCDGGFGVVYFIVGGVVDTAKAVYFEAAQSGRCVSVEPPEGGWDTARFIEALRAWAQEHGMEVRDDVTEG